MEVTGAQIETYCRKHGLNVNNPEDYKLAYAHAGDTQAPLSDEEKIVEAYVRAGKFAMADEFVVAGLESRHEVVDLGRYEAVINTMDQYSLREKSLFDNDRLGLDPIKLDELVDKHGHKKMLEIIDKASKAEAETGGDIEVTEAQIKSYCQRHGLDINNIDHYKQAYNEVYAEVQAERERDVKRKAYSFALEIMSKRLEEIRAKGVSASNLREVVSEMNKIIDKYGHKKESEETSDQLPSVDEGFKAVDTVAEKEYLDFEGRVRSATLSRCPTCQQVNVYIEGEEYKTCEHRASDGGKVSVFFSLDEESDAYQTYECTRVVKVEGDLHREDDKVYMRADCPFCFKPNITKDEAGYRMLRECSHYKSFHNNIFRFE